MMHNNNNVGYYSIERLVEFGISMTVAQQMIQGFQHAMLQASAASPGVQPQLTNRVYYVIVKDQQVGPLSYHDMITMVRNRDLNADTLVWTPGHASWLPASSFQEIMTIVALAPPAFP